jgi:hypothetical protein
MEQGGKHILQQKQIWNPFRKIQTELRNAPTHREMSRIGQASLENMQKSADSAQI